ncbi:hypothetical protein KFF05_12905 [bacterium SCSIO 12827]|nr:hypothetical protein KFF05_12905 [bacterium SCSIO 12827]
MPKISNLPAGAGLFLLMSAVFLFDTPSLRAATGNGAAPNSPPWRKPPAATTLPA